MSELAALQRLTHDYAFYNDTFRVDELVDLFLEDGVFDLSKAGLARYEGRDAIRAFFERERHATSHMIHVTTNHRFDVAGGEARGTVYFVATAQARDGAQVEARGYYDDDYVRLAGGWRFRSRVVELFFPFEPHRPGGDA